MATCGLIYKWSVQNAEGEAVAVIQIFYLQNVVVVKFRFFEKIQSFLCCEYIDYKPCNETTFQSRK